jgi:uncharacterized integral membrane protein
MSLQGSGLPPLGNEGKGETAKQLRKFGPAAVVGLLALIFILQNLDTEDVQFLWLDFAMPLWLLLVVFAVIGAVVHWGVERRRRSRRAKAE